MTQTFQRPLRFARFLPAMLLPALAACAQSGAVLSAGAVDSGGPVTVGILAINDFHGAIEPPRQSVLMPDGKAAPHRFQPAARPGSARRSIRCAATMPTA